MNIYTAVNVVPARESKAGSKFLPVWKALARIPEKSFLPVGCASVGEASHLKSECTKRGLVAERRLKVVYIQGTAREQVALESLSADPAFAETPFPGIRRIHPNAEIHTPETANPELQVANARQ